MENYKQRRPRVEHIHTIEPEKESQAPVEEDVVMGIIKCPAPLLNIREEPYLDADVVALIPNETQVVVDLKKSTNGFFQVCTASGIEGFCKREFIDLKK